MNDEAWVAKIRLVDVEGKIVGAIKRLDETTLVAALNRNLMEGWDAVVIEKLDEENCYRVIPLEAGE